MCSPIRRRSIFCRSLTSVLRLITLGCSIWRRLKVEQLAGERGGACARLVDLFYVRAQVRIVLDAVEHHPSIAADDGKQVVEVVSDAA